MFSGPPENPPKDRFPVPDKPKDRKKKNRRKIKEVQSSDSEESTDEDDFQEKPPESEKINHEFPVKKTVESSQDDLLPEFHAMENFDENSFEYKLPMTYMEKNGNRYTGQVWELGRSKFFVIFQFYLFEASNTNPGGVLVSKKLCFYQFQQMKYLQRRNEQLEKEIDNLKVIFQIVS